MPSITGINSGLDTDTIIDAIINAERGDAYLLEIQQAEKQVIINAYQALQAKFLGFNAQLGSLTKSSTFEQAAVNVSDDTILSATGSGRVSTGSYTVQVLSLARNHQLVSQGFTDDSLSDFGIGTITIQVGDGSANEITIDSGNNSLVGIKNAINNAKIGVTASIINDGTTSNAYRLILSSDNPGTQNEMTVASSLTGGLNLNYSTAVFDSPEGVSVDSGTSSIMSLGATAAYTGNENKIYTFTVAGEGEQTVGTDNITLNWTDGTNSGSIIVTQADAEVELVGVGADGLTLSMSAGTLNAGDSFEVSTFAPLLQEASNAQIALGSSSGGGSPIVVTSDTNTFADLIGGLSITVSKETDPGESVTINADLDKDAIKGQITAFIDSYNEIMEFIDDQNTYNQDADEVGALFGDSTVWSLKSRLQSAMGGTIAGLDGQFNQLYSIGIRTTGSGVLAITDQSKLDDALENNLDEVIDLFTSAGNSSNQYIDFISATSETTVGMSFDIDITQVATHGRFEGSGVTDLATSNITLANSNNRLRLKVDGLLSDEIILTAKTYQSTTELVNEIQTKIDADSKIGNRDVTVEWIDNGDGTGYLQFTSSSYGSTSKIEMETEQTNTAYDILGLTSGTLYEGLDVAGTINGETAEGSGQILTGAEDNENTEGLKIKVTLSEDQMLLGVDGTITITKGVASRLKDFVDSITKSIDGTLDRRIKAYQNQYNELTDRIADIDELLEMRRESLYRQFYEMELVLGELSVQADYLTQQLSSLKTNWKGYSND